MKKSLLVISVILLIAGLFISCNSEAAESGEDLVYVSFADEGKSLSSSITTWSGEPAPAVGGLTWYYKASKASGAQQGATGDVWTRVNNTTGLGGKIGPFSVGYWTFQLIGCDGANTNSVVYSGVSGSSSATVAESVKLTRGTTTIPVAIARVNTPSAPETINLTWNVSYPVTGTGSMYYKVSISGGNADWSSSGSDSISDGAVSINSSTTYNFSKSDFTAVTVKFEVYDAADDSDSDLKVAENSVTFPGLKGSSVAISGTLDDLDYAYGEFGDPTDLTPPTQTYEAYLNHEGSYTPKETLAAAINDATDSDTIGLLKGVTFAEDYSVAVWSKNFSLDLNGHTFTTNSTVSITDGNNGYKAAAICYGDESDPNPARTVTVSNGVINTAYGAGIYADGLNLTLVVEDVTINAAQEGAQSTLEYSSAIRLTGKANVVINSGSFTADHNGYSVAVSNSGGNVTINGGSFSAPLYFSTSTDSGVTKTITITGGAFTSFSVVNSGKGTIAISGGTFDADPSEYVDTTNYNVSHSGSTWTVTPKN